MARPFTAVTALSERLGLRYSGAPRKVFLDAPGDDWTEGRDWNRRGEISYSESQAFNTGYGANARQKRMSEIWGNRRRNEATPPQSAVPVRSSDRKKMLDYSAIRRGLRARRLGTQAEPAPLSGGARTALG